MLRAVAGAFVLLAPALVAAAAAGGLAVPAGGFVFWAYAKPKNTVTALNAPTSFRLYLLMLTRLLTLTDQRLWTKSSGTSGQPSDDEHFCCPFLTRAGLRCCCQTVW